MAPEPFKEILCFVYPALKLALCIMFEVWLTLAPFLMEEGEEGERS